MENEDNEKKLIDLAFVIAGGDSEGAIGVLVLLAASGMLVLGEHEMEFIDSGFLVTIKAEPVTTSRA